MVLQFLSTMAALYLPSLNADIIDNGVAQGDTGYIVRLGGVMLVVSLVQILCSVGAVYFGARTAMAVSAATCAPRSSTTSAASPAASSRTSARPR